MFAEARPASALKCRDISVCYGDVAALTGVSVEFAPKLIHAVVGQNGAGKTTFARVFSGLVRPDTGAIEIDGRQVAPATSSVSRRGRGTCPSELCAPALLHGRRGDGIRQQGGPTIFSRRASRPVGSSIWRTLGVRRIPPPASATCRWRPSRRWRLPAPWPARRAY